MTITLLADALETEAQALREITYDTVVGQTAGKPLDEGTAAALDEVAAEVRRIEREAASPEQAREEVRALSAQLDREAAEANSQPRELPDITQFLFNPGKLIESLQETGRLDGRRKAAEIVHKYLNGSGS